MTRQFCGNCGHHTLYKVAVSVGRNGRIVFHDRYKQFNLKGTKVTVIVMC